MSLGRFKDRVAVVVGGGSGIGAATARRLAAEGAMVRVADVNLSAARETVAGIPAAAACYVDVTDRQSVESMVRSVMAADTNVDVLVNCVGLPLAGTAADTPADVWDRVLSVNLTGTFNTCRALLPHMMARGVGAIVNVASDAALVGMRGQAAYCAAKAGVVQLSRAAALDAASRGVRVNCVCPCFTDTPLVRAWIESAADPAAALHEAMTAQPIGRMGRPEEIAAAIAFLCSDEANFITGAVLPVDGGVTARGNARPAP
jgi:meso-butanediol dehydrogenase/(S,S)-butanediol dehydrogenase/diacetyl reductase